jgi:hypothetical protein
LNDLNYLKNVKKTAFCCFPILVIMVLVLLTGCGGTSEGQKQAARKKLTDLGKNWTPEDLQQCVQTVQTDAVSLFLQSGMDPNQEVINPADPDTHKSLLHVAVEVGSPALVRILVAGGANPEFRARSLGERWNGLSPLGLALLLKRVDMVDSLLTAGADANGQMKYELKGDKHDLTPLSFVQTAADGDVPLMKLLLEKGADPNARSMKDLGREGFFFPPLHTAIANKRTDQVELLLQKGADVKSTVKVGEKEKTLLEIAQESGNAELTALFTAVEQRPPLVPPMVWVFLAIFGLGAAVFFFVPGLFRKKAPSGQHIGELFNLLSASHFERRMAGLQKLFSTFDTVTEPILLARIEELCGDDDPGVQFWAKKTRSKFVPGYAGTSMPTISSPAPSPSPLPASPPPSSSPAPVSAKSLAGVRSIPAVVPPHLTEGRIPAGFPAASGEGEGASPPTMDAPGVPLPSTTPLGVPIPPPARPSGLDELFQRLAETSSAAQCRMLIQQILDRRDPSACPRLLEYLQSCSDVMVISFLTKNLGISFPQENIVPILKNYLKHQDDRVVANTIEGLEAMGKSESFVVLAQMLSHHSHRVQANAAKALGKFDPVVSREMLLKMLMQESRPHFIIAACKAIRGTRDCTFLPALVPLAEQELVGADACEAIIALGGRKALAQLAANLAAIDDPEQRELLAASITRCDELLAGQAADPAPAVSGTPS